MKWQKHRIVVEVLTWLLTEVLLTVVGLDDVAAYGEFCLGRFASQPSHSTAIVLLKAG